MNTSVIGQNLIIDDQIYRGVTGCGTLVHGREIVAGHRCYGAQVLRTPSVTNLTRRTLLRKIQHFNPNEYFLTSYAVGTAAALGDHIHKKLWTLRNKFLRHLCINIYRRKRNNFCWQDANGGKHSYHNCRPQKRCPGSFIQSIYNYFYLQKKCLLHHP